MNTKNLSPSQTAFGFVAVFAFIAASAAVFIMPDLRAHTDIITSIIQNLNNGFWIVLGYLFGSSMGSARKTDMLNDRETTPINNIEDADKVNINVTKPVVVANADTTTTDITDTADEATSDNTGDTGTDTIDTSDVVEKPKHHHTKDTTQTPTT